jgi:hypothetical protein
MGAKNIINLFILLLIASSSCKKFKDYDDCPKVYVPSYIKAMVPYSAGQSVSFSNGSGQVVNATVSITSKFVYTPVCSACGNPYNGEYITYSLNAGSNKFMIFIVTPDTYIPFDIYSPLDNYQIPGGFTFEVEPGVSQGSCYVPRQVCLTSITLNGKTFTNALEITSQGGGSSVVKVYHTVSQGIVGFRYANGTTYALD